MQYLIKVVLSAVVIIAISEIGKRSSFMAALVASLPLSTLLAILWLYRDTQDTQKIADLCIGIFWMLQPSFVFLLALPIFLKKGWGFGLSLTLSIFLTALTYAGYQIVLKKFNLV